MISIKQLKKYGWKEIKFSKEKIRNSRKDLEDATKDSNEEFRIARMMSYHSSRFYALD